MRKDTMCINLHHNQIIMYVAPDGLAYKPANGIVISLTYDLTYGLAGGLVGFLMFVILLESKGMQNVLYRRGVFVPRNLVKYIRSPFNSTVLWHPALWKHNWIIMTVCGGIIGTLFV